MNVRAAGSSETTMRNSVLIAALAAGLLAVAMPAAALEAGARAQEIGLRDQSGNMVRLSQLRGKVVLVDFWASWCRPCEAELPVLQRLYERHRAAGLVVLGVNRDRQERNMRSMLSRFNITFPVVHDGDGRIAGLYGPTTMPSSYLVDRAGVVRHVHRGFRASDAAELDRRVQALLRSGSR